MNCYCCGKPLKNNDINGWHPACVKRFFGTTTIPKIEIDEKTLEEIAKANTSKGITVPGVQKKLSLHLHSDNNGPRLTLVNYPTGYILKPQVAEFECLPEAEQLVMTMADITGIATVPHALIRSKDTFAYITKRVDRAFDKAGVHMFAMEDFCQLAGRTTADKYKGSYENCGKIIRRYSQNTGLDLAELYYRLLFCFVTGNSDMHYKNFSLIEKEPGSRMFGLSAAYDLLPVNVILPEDKEETALTLNGKKRNIRKKDFLQLGTNLGISEHTAETFIKRIDSLESLFCEMIEESYVEEKMKTSLTALIKERMKRLI